MKNYLLKITFIGTLCFGLFSTSCSDDDEKAEIVDIPTVSTCLSCPELIIDQTNSSGSETFTYPAGTVCKGIDGKAYYENGDPVDELGQTFEDHIDFLGTYARVCTEVQN